MLQASAMSGVVDATGAVVGVIQIGEQAVTVSTEILSASSARLRHEADAFDHDCQMDALLTRRAPG